MTFNDRSFALAQLGYLPVIAITALIMPGAGMTTLMLSMAGSWIVTALCYQATSERNSVGWWALLTMQTALGSAAVVIIHLHNSISPIALAANISLTGIAVIASASLACRVLAPEGLTKRAIHNRALIVTASTLPFISAAVTATAYPALYAGIALTGYGMTALQSPGLDRKSDFRLWGAFIAGIALIALADLRFCAVTAIGIFWMLPWKKGRAYMRGAWLTAIVAVTWIAGNIIDSSAGEMPAPNPISTEWLLALPAEIIQLYLAPLPWEGASSATVITWYATGALIIYFGIRGWRHSSGTVRRLSACAAMLWLATACFFGSNCWQQALALLPWMIPGATASMDTIRADRHRFAIYLTLYSLALCAGLTIAYTYR